MRLYYYKQNYLNEWVGHATSALFGGLFGLIIGEEIRNKKIIQKLNKDLSNTDSLTNLCNYILKKSKDDMYVWKQEIKLLKDFKRNPCKNTALALYSYRMGGMPWDIMYESITKQDIDKVKNWESWMDQQQDGWRQDIIHIDNCIEKIQETIDIISINLKKKDYNVIEQYISNFYTNYRKEYHPLYGYIHCYYYGTIKIPSKLLMVAGAAANTILYHYIKLGLVTVIGGIKNVLFK